MGAHYPGLWHDDHSDWVWGALVIISKEEREKIDEYEGEEYTIQQILVYVGDKTQEAYSYIRPPVSDKEWNLAYIAPPIPKN